MRITVKVVPRASRDAVLGWQEGLLRVAVTAAPERGRANQALEALLADVLGVPRRAVRVVAGHTSSRKLLEIDGLDEVTAHARLDGAR